MPVSDTATASSEAKRSIAEVAGKAIDLTRDLGLFLDKIFGPAASELGVLLGDRVALWKRLNLLSVARMWRERCDADGIDVDAIEPLDFGRAVQALEAAAWEDNDDVQALWAQLLANAANPQCGVTLKKLYVSLLKDLGPAEAALLELVGEFRKLEGKQFNPTDFSQVELELNAKAEVKWRKFSEADRIGAIVNLRRLGCIAPDISNPPIQRLLTQSAVQAPARGLSSGGETRVFGVNPQEFQIFISWLLDAVMSAGGGTTPKLPKVFPMRNALGGVVGSIAVPELGLALTPLGEDLVRACTRPKL